MPIKPAIYKILIICDDAREGEHVESLFKAVGFNNCQIKKDSTQITPENFDMILNVLPSTTPSPVADPSPGKSFFIGNATYPRPFTSMTIIKLIRESEKLSKKPA